MYIICKHCGSSNYRKDGYSKVKQRYKCRDCDRIFSQGDRREKYGIEKKIRVIKLYTDGVGLRTIERSEGISTPLLIYWIRNIGRLLKQHILKTEVPSDAKDIAILEMDELFTYYQKKHKKPMFGLLWTETGIKLLI
jgi:transposase-like protein